MRKLILVLPLQFRVLYRQFLLRVIDLEALSIEADIPGFIGQFAGVLIFISLVSALKALSLGGAPPEMLRGICWTAEQQHISGIMLVVGLFAVVSWDTTFPDKRDAMVLSPLPITPQIILLAKLAASSTIIGVAILSLNFAAGLAWPILAAKACAGNPLRALAAYWFTMVAACAFLYGTVLTVQGMTALSLPRGLFLRLSALLQLLAFGLFLGVYFLQPTIDNQAAMTTANNYHLLVCLPSFWFFALFNQLNGSLPASLGWLATEAWIGLALAVSGAGASLLLCYLRTMRKTVEEPDLVPSSHGLHWTPRLGSALQTAVLFFTIRSLVRSKQHRVIFAFFLAGVFGAALSSVKDAWWAGHRLPLSIDFLALSYLMMVLAIVGLRSVFALPITLHANWVLRTTQLRSTRQYVSATRRTLLLLATLPAWLLVAALSDSFYLWREVMAHLAVLALWGLILTEVSLLGFYKLPFTCSVLPGKINIQFLFWGFFVFAVIFAYMFADFEIHALHNPQRFGFLLVILAAIAGCLWGFNRHRARSAILYFEELPPETITTLGIASLS
jgi:hypothetical protein